MLSPRGRPGQLLDIWHAGGFELLLSDWQYNELNDVFSRPKIVRDYRITPPALANLFAHLALATRAVPFASVSVSSRDAKDQPILDGALGGGADVLVTGDDDLLVLRGDPRLGSLQVVTVVQFLAMLEDRAETETHGQK